MFKWGIKKGVGIKNKDYQYYESFFYYNVQYFLYDYVYLYSATDVDAYIGKIVKIIETPNHERKVKVVWLFRPAEIRNYLRDYKPMWNEVFLACGEGKGTSNINNVESIIGKCNVVCGSRDIRNPQASEEQLRTADFIFFHCFDVVECRILENFVDHISANQVEYYFNKPKDQRDIIPSNGHGYQVTRKFKSTSQLVQGAEHKKRVDNLGVQEHISVGNAMLRPKNLVDCTETDGSNFWPSQHPPADGSNFWPSQHNPADGSNFWPSQKRKLLPDEIHEKATIVSQDVGPHVAHRTDESIPSFKKKRLPLNDGKETLVSQEVGPHVAQGANTISITEKRKWFSHTTLTSERLKRAEEAGTLVSLQNLDPSFTSTEVEDLVRQAFNQIVEAKMIPRSTFSSPYCGKALVIFKSKVDAEFAISKLRKRCLIMEDGRPIVGGKGFVNSSVKADSFCGHLSIHQLRQRQSEDMRKAVSTSHCSQHNTIEYEMATEWGILQEQSDLWWNTLYTKQAAAVEDVKRQLKRN